MQASLDKIDLIIIKNLLEDGRASFSSIAKETKLTDVAIKKRVESLRRRGVISKISANLNYKVLGFENPIYVQIRSEIGKNKDLIKRLGSFDYVVELYQVLGEYNLLAKLIVNDLDSAEKLIGKLGLIDGILDLKTLVVLSELKQGNVMPSTALQKRL
ncbi:MAG: Lrp/AsnC family transcriptional regulator [Candidatus Diapherotrites archaeon]|uniref:Lrp/AsnC family transcriptional regulator n=1 Tax=Candidatus Iainarchaeum sp. TaxID=3101447 RepID=A0A939C9A7_9ARCH|nr:Lrp/AsnC family transcriptional regulator [Candidatus Diapherotrites archaeon]